MIIGLCGFKGSGKDTVAAYLVKNHEFERRAFADPMKRSIAALFDIPFQEVEWLKVSRENFVWIEKDGVAEPTAKMNWRQFMQRFGTESHRDIFGEDFWLEYTLPSNGHYHGRLIVITDVRFSNEAKRVKELGGRIWFVDRVTDRSSFDPHASENLDFGTDFMLPNNGTLDDLYATIEEALSVVVG